MILTTTLTIEGRAVSEYLGVIGSEVIFGSTFVRDWFAQAADVVGGRAGVYEEVYETARKDALSALEKKAALLRADAVLGIRFDYQVLGASNGMLMVAATGTAVRYAETPEMKQRREQAEKEEVPRYFAQIGGREVGPFSIAQMRELVLSGHLHLGQMVRTEDDTHHLLKDLLS